MHCYFEQCACNCACGTLPQARGIATVIMYEIRAAAVTFSGYKMMHANKECNGRVYTCVNGVSCIPESQPVIGSRVYYLLIVQTFAASLYGSLTVLHH